MSQFKETSKKKVLFVAFYFPPILTGGVFRPVKFVKYLPYFGWNPTILTVTELSFVDEDKDLLNELKPNVEIYRVPFFSPQITYRKIRNMFRTKASVTRTSSKRIEISSNNVTARIKTFFTKLINTMILPDIQVLWLPFAVLKSLYLIKRHSISVVLTTSPPNSSHLIGFILQKIARVNWVADFRDPWFSLWSVRCLSFIVPDIRYKLEKSLEKMVLRSADKVVCVSKGDRMMMEKALPAGKKDKFCVITNGYDREDFSNLKMIYGRNSKFTICHLGYLYKKSADDFFHAIESLLQGDDELMKNMEIRFVGEIDETYKKRIKNSDFHSNFSLVGQLSHHDALQEIIDSDVLLVALCGNLFDDGEIPGKIFEYMASGKVILTIAPKAGNTAEILAESGLGEIVEPDDPQSIKKILYELYRQKKKGTLKRKVNQDFLKRFERKSLTEELAFLLDETLSQSS